MHGSLIVTPELLLRAYAAGLFPMAERREDASLFWVDPEARGIPPPAPFHLPPPPARPLPPPPPARPHRQERPLPGAHRPRLRRDHPRLRRAGRGPRAELDQRRD